MQPPGIYRYCAIIAILAALCSSCARPTAEFSYLGNHTAPAILRFDNRSAKATGFHWDFGDGTQSDTPSPEHTYLSSGNYTVTLHAFKGRARDTARQQIQIKAPVECLVSIETEYGVMTAVLYNGTPQHRDHFTQLAEGGFFDGLIFHRVIQQFMIQGGDPLLRKTKPGPSISGPTANATLPAEISDTLFHIKGAIAAARTGNDINPKKASSATQFYIVQGRTWTDEQLDQIEAQKGIRYDRDTREAYKTIGGAAQLDREYTVFGRVIDGLDVIDKIAAVQIEANDRPAEDIVMKIKVIK